MNTEPLKKLGLQEAEIEVYLSLLTHGISSAAEIAKNTKLNRSHIYDKLENLLQRGLVSSIIKNNVAYYKAADPKKIFDNLKSIEEEMKVLLPQLQKIQQLPKKETAVELYYGKEGMKTVFKDVLQENKDYYVFGEEGKFQEVFPVFTQQFLREVKSKKLVEHLLSKEKLRGKIAVTSFSRIKYLPDTHFSPTMTTIYGNKVAIFIWSEPSFVVLIKDKEVAQSYKSYFDVLWKIAKK